jgi:hypothetical protein
MLHKIALAWVLSFLVILAYEGVHHACIGRRNLPEPVRFLRHAVLMLAGIFYYTSSALFGAFAALYLNPPAGLMEGRLEAAAGLLLGLWLLGIFLQIALNAARKLTGAQVRPLVYFNKDIFAFIRTFKKGAGED